jgi:ABC-type branched-subunit amino acid transport system substrate-binding protein
VLRQHARVESNGQLLLRHELDRLAHLLESAGMSCEHVDSTDDAVAHIVSGATDLILISDAFAAEAERLITQEKVSVVFGCWTSSSRKAVGPVFEKHNHLLFYPVQYEGNETSRNVIYGGQVPNQQVLPALDWLRSGPGGERKKFFLLGSDYVYPRTTNFIVRKWLAGRAAEIVGEEYVPLGAVDVAPVVARIVDSGADCIINMDISIVGVRSAPLLTQLASTVP